MKKSSEIFGIEIRKEEKKKEEKKNEENEIVLIEMNKEENKQ